MVFKGTTRAYKRICLFNSNWISREREVSKIYHSSWIVSNSLLRYWCEAQLRYNNGLKTGLDFRGQVWKRVWKMVYFGQKLGQDLGNRAAGYSSEFSVGVPCDVNLSLERWDQAENLYTTLPTNSHTVASLFPLFFEIIITISIENCTKNKSKAFVAFRVIFNTYCYYNFNPWGMFESLTSLSPIRQPSLGTRLINGGRKFSEINVKIKWLLMFVMDWNLARWVRRSNCTRKCKKMKIKNLIIGAL